MGSVIDRLSFIAGWGKYVFRELFVTRTKAGGAQLQAFLGTPAPWSSQNVAEGRAAKAKLPNLHRLNGALACPYAPPQKHKSPSQWTGF